MLRSVEQSAAKLLERSLLRGHDDARTQQRSSLKYTHVVSRCSSTNNRTLRRPQANLSMSGQSQVAERLKLKVVSPGLRSVWGKVPPHSSTAPSLLSSTSSGRRAGPGAALLRPSASRPGSGERRLPARGLAARGAVPPPSRGLSPRAGGASPTRRRGGFLGGPAPPPQSSSAPAASPGLAGPSHAPPSPRERVAAHGPRWSVVGRAASVPPRPALP